MVGGTGGSGGEPERVGRERHVAEADLVAAEWRPGRQGPGLRREQVRAMKRLLPYALALAFLVALPGTSRAQLGEWGDAPEGALAYLTPAVMGQFPTCAAVGPAGFIRHGPLCWAHFPGNPTPWDLEVDGNATNCPNFPPYDADECFLDDAGLIFPDAWTIDPTPNIVPCPLSGQPPPPTTLQTCIPAQWGVDIDIMVVNNMPVVGYVNVLFDWDQGGSWGGGSTCPSVGTALEHVLVDHPIPMGYMGPLSGLGPPSFLVGPNDQYVWCRFSITETQVGTGWDGSGVFEDGETEDYLLEIHDPTPVERGTWSTIKAIYR
jgi:hypothetical protein